MMDRANRYEEWRPVEGWPYEISSQGRLRNNAGRIMRDTRHPHGYRLGWMRHAGKRRREYIHRLVAFAFLGPPPSPDHHADHIDGDRSHNALTNIRWLSPEDNRALRRIRRGETHHGAKLSSAEVRAIRENTTENNVQLARRLGVRRETVRDIRLGKERQHDAR